MPRSTVLTRSGLVATLAAAGLVLAGCGSSATSAPATTAPAPPPATTAPPSGAPSAAALGWTGNVCTALDPLVHTLGNPPAVNAADAAATRQAYLTYLNTAQQQANQALQQVQAAGAPPAGANDQAGNRIQQELTNLRDNLTQARDQLQQADPNNPASVGPAIASAGSVLKSAGDSAKTLSTLQSDPQLGPAFQQAPSCAPLRNTAGS